MILVVTASHPSLEPFCGLYIWLFLACKLGFLIVGNLVKSVGLFPHHAKILKLHSLAYFGLERQENRLNDP